jgi:hypothetical protein
MTVQLWPAVLHDGTASSILMLPLLHNCLLTCLQSQGPNLWSSRLLVPWDLLAYVFACDGVLAVPGFSIVNARRRLPTSGVG